MRVQETALLTSNLGAHKLYEMIMERQAEGWLLQGGPVVVTDFSSDDVSKHQEDWTVLMVRPVDMEVNVKTLVKTGSSVAFEQDLENYIRDGWELHGSPFPIKFGETHLPTVAQMVIRKRPREPYASRDR
jgi:hypothetical protein